jgi:hypothetical protein
MGLFLEARHSRRAFLSRSPWRREVARRFRTALHWPPPGHLHDLFPAIPPRPGQRDGSAHWLSEAYGNRLLAVARVPSRERDRPSIP